MARSQTTSPRSLPLPVPHDLRGSPVPAWCSPQQWGHSWGYSWPTSALMIRPGKALQGLQPPWCRRDSSSYQFDHQRGSLPRHSVLPNLKEADAAGAGAWPVPWTVGLLLAWKLKACSSPVQTTHQQPEPWRSPVHSSVDTASTPVTSSSSPCCGPSSVEQGSGGDHCHLQPETPVWEKIRTMGPLKTLVMKPEMVISQRMRKIASLRKPSYLFVERRPFPGMLAIRVTRNQTIWLTSLS